MLRVLVVLLVGLVCLSAPAIAKDDAAKKEELARELMELTGASRMGKQVMDQMLGSMRNNPAMSSEFIDRFSAEIDADQLVEMVVPIYVEHLDVKTLKAAVKFYRTQEGRALIAKMPVIMQESMTVGQQWGAEMGRRVMQQLQEDSRQDRLPDDG